MRLPSLLLLAFAMAVALSASQVLPWGGQNWTRITTACDHLAGVSSPMLPGGHAACDRDSETLQVVSSSGGSICFERSTATRRTLSPSSWLRSKSTNGTLHCLPRTYLLGPDKTGTTALFQKLSQFDGWVETPVAHYGRMKETGFFSNYRGQSGLLARYSQSYYGHVTEHDTTIEGTPYHLYRSKPFHLDLGSVWQRGPYAAARRFSCALPSARFIVTVRDPVNRTWSDYVFYGRLTSQKQRERCFRQEDGFLPSAAHFHESVQSQLPVLRECLLAKNEPPVSKRKICVDMFTLQLEVAPFEAVNAECWLLAGRPLVSLVAVHLRAWLQRFACSEILVVPLEEFRRDELDGLRRVLAFLGLEIAAAATPSLAAGERDVPDERLREVAGQLPFDPATDNAFNRQRMSASTPVKEHRPLAATEELLREFFAEFWNLPVLPEWWSSSHVPSQTRRAPRRTSATHFPR